MKLLPDKTCFHIIDIPGKQMVVAILVDDDGHKYRGTAKCAPGDAFDNEFGTQLAYLRAKEKYVKACRNRALSALEYYEDEITDSMECAAKWSARYDSAQNKLNAITCDIAELLGNAL